MKVLFYAAALVDYHTSPLMKDGWDDFYFKPLCKTLLNSGSYSKEDIYFIFFDDETKFYKEFCDRLGVRYTIIHGRNFRKLYKDTQSYFSAFYKDYELVNESDMTRMCELLTPSFKSFTPDAILPFATPIPFLKYMFPNAVILESEAGFSTRAPFPQTLYFDPFGGTKCSFLKKHGADLLTLQLEDKQKAWVTKFKNFFTKKIRCSNPYYHLSVQFKNFEKVLLLPLAIPNLIFEFEAGVDNILFQICHVMDNIPESFGVVVTEYYPRSRGNTINDEMLSYLRERYKNLIFIPELRDYESPSQYLLDMVDGVVTDCSSIGIQAMLWDKPVFVTCDSHIAPFAEKVELSQVGEFLDKCLYKNKDNALYYLLTRYYIPRDEYLCTSRWFPDFLEQCVNRVRAGEASIDFYSPIDDEDKLIEYLTRNSKDIPVRLVGHDDRVSFLENELHLKHSYIQNIEDELNVLKNRIAHLEQSTSWKVTKPLRYIKDKVLN